MLSEYKAQQSCERGFGFLKDTLFFANLVLRLADGSEALLSIHLATIVWDGIEKLVPVLATDYKPLLGTSFMGGYHLEIDFQDDGLVSLEKL